MFVQEGKQGHNNEADLMNMTTILEYQTKRDANDKAKK